MLLAPHLIGPRAVVSFWKAAGPGRWFGHHPLFDAQVRRRLGVAQELAAEGLLDGWAATPLGALALCILLDQAPRNMFRGTPQVYASDAQARMVADAAIAAGFDRRVPRQLRQFFYLPFMHSESLQDQERCVALYRAAGDAFGRKWAEHHREIVERFGRFPHRNAILSRASTPEETRFLESGGFRG